MSKGNQMKGWKCDTGKKGSRIIFKDYQKEIINIMEAEPERRFNSLEVWNALKARKIKISRASVIFFLNFLVEDGLALYVSVPGKGGMHKQYSFMRTWDKTKTHIAIKIIRGLAEGLDKDLDSCLDELM